MKGKFQFNGEGGKLFSLFFVQGLLTVITCGIYGPWAMAKIYGYFAESLTLDGKAFKFTGQGGDMFSLFFVQMLLTTVTCGIYEPFATLKIRKYFTEHIEYEGKAFAFSDDNGCDFWCLLFVQGLLTTITCGIYTPWAMINISKNVLERTSYDGKKFSLTAEGGALFSLYFVQGLLTVITFGIYTPWAMAKISNYLNENTTYGDSGKFASTYEGGPMFSLFFVQGLLTVVTCGIYAPWAMVKIYQYYTSNLELK